MRSGLGNNIKALHISEEVVGGIRGKMGGGPGDNSENKSELCDEMPFKYHVRYNNFAKEPRLTSEPTLRPLFSRVMVDQNRIISS